VDCYKLEGEVRFEDSFHPKKNVLFSLHIAYFRFRFLSFFRSLNLFSVLLIINPDHNK